MNVGIEGILLLWSVGSLGRDGRTLPVHAVLCALCMAQTGPIGALAGAVLVGAGLLAWGALRQLAPQDTGVTHARWWPVVCAVVLSAAVVRGGVGLPQQGALVVASVLAGLVGVATASEALAGCAAMLRTLNACVVLACLGGHVPTLLVAGGLWVSVAAVALLVMPRLSWLRSNDPHE